MVGRDKEKGESTKTHLLESIIIMSNNFYDNFKNLKIVNNIHVCWKES